MADGLKKLREDLQAANESKKGKGVIDVSGMASKLKDTLSSSPYRKKAPEPAKEVKTAPDMARGTKGLQDTVGSAMAQASMKLEQDRRAKAEAAKARANTKPSVTPLTDTSDQYWSPSDSDSGNYGSASGEIGPSYKKGGFVHHSQNYKKHAAGHMTHMDHVKKNFKGK